MFEALFSRPDALLGALVMVAISFVVAGGIGYSLGNGVAEADGDAALAKLQKEHADAVAQATDEARLRLLAEVERNNRLAQALADEKAAHAEEKQSLLRRIANVTTVYVPVPGDAAQPLPRAVFTVGFVHEYNAAIGVPATDASASAAGPGATANAAAAPDAGLRDSGLSQADILAHVADYGERCRNLEAQVNSLLARDQEAPDGHR